MTTMLIANGQILQEVPEETTAKGSGLQTQISISKTGELFQEQRVDAFDWMLAEVRERQASSMLTVPVPVRVPVSMGLRGQQSVMSRLISLLGIN